MDRINEYLSIVQYLKLNDLTDALIQIDSIINSMANQADEQSQLEKLIEEVFNERIR